ncbi:hypothetical protein BL250_17405 [Erwinia sp. OLTSP20]|nr:hypothetical protein BV501_18250 [Erwinia sp. OAMSP11]PIJ67720.1 hypothetical protein BK416_16840 [Erwinia sp. OLSSP12]PIJ78199.1 hypothetical protein BLD47_17300 [Erwinia sp. OLCASP19]PIJ79348.1 hypothetical protein BLD46_17200 [Erwinia sp. OLMTSP26]PIJ80914.1 hypothetical protein BLD49_16965 [Erwinia sp. OLMDSP33]PIJ88407.1 hypothetical protein BL250_17405 [Erwinia sp. OLTSP20]PIJ92438.1 hypothetical protein BL249_06320 [Erwinia sp. OLFS4]
MMAVKNNADLCQSASGSPPLSGKSRHDAYFNILADYARPPRNFRLISDHPATLYLICLLPPAANIIVPETHYPGSGHSAKIITGETCLSLLAISLFAIAIFSNRTLGIRCRRLPDSAKPIMKKARIYAGLGVF